MEEGLLDKQLAYCFSLVMDYVFNRFLLYCHIIPLSREACFNQIHHIFLCFSKTKPSVHQGVFLWAMKEHF